LLDGRAEDRMLANPQRILLALDDRKAVELGHQLFERAGVAVGGDRPWDIQINDERLFTRVFRDGTLGFGEAYVDGWWDAPALDQMIERVLRARLDLVVRDSWVMLAHVVRARVFNLQGIARAFEVGERHYDIGNDLYERMLDPYMMYTCAYWKDAANLAEAQQRKLELICQKIGIRPGMRILELGCGWGGFAAYAAERHGAHVVGLTVSREQVAWGKQRWAGLPIELRLEDYRKAEGSYDAVVSIGLMEHVGPKNYRTYMEVADRCLANGGVSLVHTIAGNSPRGQVEPWFHKYIFPNAVMPTLAQVAAAAEELLVVEDVHNLGEHYDRTLLAWWDNFDAAWGELRAHYGDRFYRMWRYYLLGSAAGFRARYLQLYQLVLTRKGTPQPACRVS
jgi:cyclopropane-fatty-acyl-phospholipid synthase